MPCNRRAVLADLTRFWSMTVDQVARRAVGAESTAANRLAQLVDDHGRLALLGGPVRAPDAGPDGADRGRLRGRLEPGGLAWSGWRMC
jgi:hypothetical protein